MNVIFKNEIYDKQSIEKGIYHKNTSIHLIDVRTKAKYDDGHPLVSNNLPFHGIGSIYIVIL